MHPVDYWRVVSPLEEIQKHTDWKVDYVTDWTFGKKDMSEVATYIGLHYDLIVSSYNISKPEAYAWLKVIQKKFGVKHILDVDDDLVNIDPQNPSILTIWHEGNSMTKEFFVIDTVIRDSENLTVTTNSLKKLYEKRRKNKKEPIILANKINLSMYRKHLPRSDNKIMIGYFGGVSHHGDLHDSGFLDAMNEIMNTFPQVYFESVGMPVVDFPLPRYEFIEGPNTGGKPWGEFLSLFQWDICVAPLADTLFNNGKSDIKWQESTAIGCPVVASFKRPYIKAIEHGKTGFLANSREEWVKYLTLLIENKQLRQEIAKNAYEEVKKNHALENHWQQWKEYYERL